MYNHIHSSWIKTFDNYFQTTEGKQLEEKVKLAYANSTIEVYPSQKDIFKAFELTSFSDLKVVIIGQDPYHGAKQANGLCFSVSDNVKIPPSLKNIYKEINTDLKIPISNSGNLESWAKQGILLLNTCLTVEAGKPGSHKNFNWELFTDYIIKEISNKKNDVVFLLWGNFAIKKAQLIESSKHFILEAAHPSPLARGAFFGCQHFSKTNNFLKEKGLKEIDWQIGEKSNQLNIF